MDDLEITEEMIAAGLEAIGPTGISETYEGWLSPTDLVCRIYLAMRRAKESSE